MQPAPHRQQPHLAAAPQLPPSVKTLKVSELKVHLQCVSRLLVAASQRQAPRVQREGQRGAARRYGRRCIGRRQDGAAGRARARHGGHSGAGRPATATNEIYLSIS